MRLAPADLCKHALNEENTVAATTERTHLELNSKRLVLLDCLVQLSHYLLVSLVQPLQLSEWQRLWGTCVTSLEFQRHQSLPEGGTTCQDAWHLAGHEHQEKQETDKGKEWQYIRLVIRRVPCDDGSLLFA